MSPISRWTRSTSDADGSTSARRRAAPAFFGGRARSGQAAGHAAVAYDVFMYLSMRRTPSLHVRDGGRHRDHVGRIGGAGRHGGDGEADDRECDERPYELGDAPDELGPRRLAKHPRFPAVVVEVDRAVGAAAKLLLRVQGRVHDILRLIATAAIDRGEDAETAVRRLRPTLDLCLRCA